MNAIEIKGLTKNFGNKQALKGLNMTVPVGSIYGFIGENGSGKSTTEKLICGLLVPNGGSIKLFGRDYTDADVRAKVGVLIEAPRNAKGENNALAVAYCCNCSFDPPMVMVGIVPSRHSYAMVKESGCFVVNLVPKAYRDTYMYLGSRSGRDEDKLKAKNVRLAEGEKVNAPILSDCPRIRRLQSGKPPRPDWPFSHSRRSGAPCGPPCNRPHPFRACWRRTAGLQFQCHPCVGRRLLPR